MNNLNKFDFDVLVIGSGPGGYIAALQGAKNGLKVACVEKMDSLGGTCLNVGCIPSKALLHSSETYSSIKKSSAEEGVNVTGLTFDLSTMMKRKNDIVLTLVNGIASHFKKLSVERLTGSAAFLDKNTVDISGKKVTAKNFIIATGSEPMSLPFLPFDEKQVVSSTGALSLTSVPKRLVVIGAGVIGVELASVYSRLGSKVTIVEMLESITPTMDVAVSRQLLQTLKKQEMEFFLGAKVKGAVINKKGVTLAVEHESKDLSFDADVVLVAVGRRPYTKGLGLESAGITVTPKGFITVDNNFRTVHPHIYAIGDVIDGPMLAHRASHEGVAVADLIAGKSASVNYTSIPNVIYTHPEVASVGFTETEARAAGLNIFVGTSFFRANGRARCIGDIEGFVKVIGEKQSGRLIGMHIIGPEASELITEGIVALDLKAKVHDIAHACHAHPTLSEAVMEAAQQALDSGI